MPDYHPFCFYLLSGIRAGFKPILIFKFLTAFALGKDKGQRQRGPLSASDACERNCPNKAPEQISG
jgi:hypothetical protein